ncbi:hypothetical protein Purlil1_12902 [Purpureocillium lilacinum]|uniref:DUF7587 domain-containing protein n=1 Tax=Purpureocillium lilacinum TaxID=33203 RepID=A0ABR0BFM3_PURLI|nr:hypothetical protein Purlil1_12902 [Purpureocillium lilacinum]
MNERVDQRGWRYGVPPVCSYPVRLQSGKGPPLSKEDCQFNHQSQQLAAKLRAARTKLLRLLDENTFILRNIGLLEFKLDGDSGRTVKEAAANLIPYYDSPPVDAAEELRMISQRSKDAIFSRSLITAILKARASNILREPLVMDEPPEIDTAQFMLRAVLPHSATRYDADLGFLCGNFASAQPDFHAETLEYSQKLDRNGVTKHCEGVYGLSDYISMFDLPRRMLKYMDFWSKESVAKAYIAVISTTKLQKMGVLFNRTTTLARKLNIPRPMYATSNFWISYRWIPAECIECYLTVEGFHAICGPSNYDKSLTIDDLLMFRGHCFEKTPPVNIW